MSKRFWMFVTFSGALVFVAGLILTIVLTIETGEVVDDSECGDALGPVATAEIELASCVTSDDPKVLLGLAPLLLGGTMVGVGIWRWIVTAQADGSSGGGSGGDGGGDGIGGLMGSIKNLQDQAMKLQQQSMESSGTMSAGTAAPAPPPASTDPPASAT
jgi:hypothetical protein